MSAIVPAENAPKDPIQGLREAMDKVRAAREVGGLAVGLARYEVDTELINKDFITGFQDILPIKPVYRNVSGAAMSMHVKDPLDIRAVTSFGIFIRQPGDIPYPAFIIGGRSVGENTGLREALMLGWKKGRENKGRETEYSPTISILTTAEKPWMEWRDKAVSMLATPFDTKRLMDYAYNSDEQTFEIKSDNLTPDMAVAEALMPWYSSNLKTGLSMEKTRRQLTKRSDPQGGHLIYSGIVSDSRSLRSADFVDYSVMYHLETIAAAFGVGEKFNELKAIREGKMPVNPEESFAELPGYRKALETGTISPDPAK